MTTLMARLRFALETRGKKPAELARAVGASGAAVSLWLSGKTLSLTSENLLAASHFLKCSATWLSSGVGPSGLINDELSAAREERRVSVCHAATIIGAALSQVDKLTRKQAGLVLQELADTPDMADQWGRRLEQTLLQATRIHENDQTKAK